MENERVVTKEDALERINNNMKTIDTGYGQIHVNKKFFRNCAIVGGVSTGVGAVLLATVGFVLVPIAVTGLGVIATATNGAFYFGEKLKEEDLEDAYTENKAFYLRIKGKEENSNKAKVKSKKEATIAEKVASRNR